MRIKLFAANAHVELQRVVQIAFVADGAEYTYVVSVLYRVG